MNKLFVALTLLFALAIGSTGRNYWRMTRLNRDARQIEGRVAVQATYQFEVEGKKYRGTFESSPGARGSEVLVYYSPSHPELNSPESPDQALRSSGRLLMSLTGGFLFWACGFAVLGRLRRT